MATVFLNMPAAEGVRQYPELAGAYAMAEATDKQAKADGLTLAQRELLRDEIRRRIAKAIEDGRTVRPNVKEQMRPAPALAQEQRKDRGREPER